MFGARAAQRHQDKYYFFNKPQLEHQKVVSPSSWIEAHRRGLGDDEKGIGLLVGRFMGWIHAHANMAQRRKLQQALHS